MVTDAIVEAEYHQFLLTSEHTDPTATTETGSVIDVGRNLVVVHTGVAAGPVVVALSVLDQAPAIEIDNWDNIVGTVINADRPLKVMTTLGDVNDSLATVPAPDTGFLAVRVSTRGRAEHWDAVVDSPSENYLVEVWPNASPRPIRVIKETDDVWTDKPVPSTRGGAQGSAQDATVKLGGPVRWGPGNRRLIRSVLDRLVDSIAGFNGAGRRHLVRRSEDHFRRCCGN